MAAAWLSVAVTAGIVVSLLAPTVTFFTHVGIGEFLTGTEWTGGFGDKFVWTTRRGACCRWWSAPSWRR